MRPLTENRIILIERPTRLDELIMRHNTPEQARFHVERLGVDFGDYEEEHSIYKTSLALAKDALATLGILHTVERRYLPNYIFGRKDVVVALGQDGLVANTLKYLNGQILVGVNPDPRRNSGLLLPFNAIELGLVMPEILAGKRDVREITLAKATLNDTQALYGVNDIFIGQRTHVSARYEIAANGKKERQSSSGIIVSTGLGSTGWFKSIVAGAAGITSGYLGAEIKKPDNTAFAWNLRRLAYCVREPFTSVTTGANMVYGEITDKKELVVTSQMAENGVIFSDGMEADYLEFNSGAVAKITIAEKTGLLAV
ncbi:MAG: sugar kinase [Deltaproteobacteria bacterium]|nr:sugar kinase [Deltaproteobacteria bacterium]